MGSVGEQAPLHVEVGEDADGPVIVITGELDISNVASVQAAIDLVLVGKPTYVRFETSGLTFIDSSGIAVLVRAAKAVDRVRLVNPSRIVCRVVEISGLASTLIGSA